MMAMHMERFSLSFQVCNTWRTARTFAISTRPGRPEELRALLPHLGKAVPKIGKGKIENVGFVHTPCPDADDSKRAKQVIDRLEVKPNACAGLSVVGELEGEAALLHVVQTVDGKEVGGLSVLVMRAPKVTKGKE
jgi:hypothetical protein